jgi:hypothetical protein
MTPRFPSSSSKPEAKPAKITMAVRELNSILCTDLDEGG